MSGQVRTETDTRGVATLWLARPEKHNALSAELIDEITAAAQRLAQDPAVRVVVLAAEGKSFCAGGDLRWMETQMAAGAAERAASTGSAPRLCLPSVITTISFLASERVRPRSESTLIPSKIPA